MSKLKAGVFIILILSMASAALEKPAVAAVPESAVSESEVPESTVSKNAENADDGSILKLPEAELLLVYRQKPSRQEMASLQIIVKILTYLQHSVAYLPMDQAGPVTGEYKAVICFGLDNGCGSFIRKLIKEEHQLFVIGSCGMEQYIAAKGSRITCVRTDAPAACVTYRFPEGNEYAALVNIKDGLLLKDGLSYTSGTIAAEGGSASLYSGNTDFIYLSVTDLTDPLLQASLAEELAKWLWPYKGEPYIYSQFIVLDEVYPFTPPEKLLQAVEYFIKLKLPFVISVMPIYENGDYPSMQRFCEVLRYAQANGGAILMHAPVIKQEEDRVEQLWKYLTIATEAYTNKGVYPLGIEAPERFMFTQTGREILKRYSTVFFYPDGGDSCISLEEAFNLLYRDGHKIVAPAVALDEQGESKVTVYSAACYINMAQELALIKEKTEKLQALAPPLKDLWDMEHVVYADNLYLFTKDRQAYLNGEKVSLKYVPFQYDKNFDYENGVFQWIFSDLKELNNKLVFVVIISSLSFIILILRARLANRKRFLTDKKEGR